MKKIILPVFLIIFLLPCLCAQTFSNNTVTILPDVNTTVVIPITVSGLPVAINSGYGLTTICLNLTHPFIGELTAVLKAPTGTDSVRLLWHDGGNIAINSGICITESATQYIATYHTWVNTNYFGEEDNNIMNNGRNPNGVWTLRITDVIPGNAGQFNSGSISFGNNPPPTHSRIFGCSVSSPWGCRCPDGTTDCDLLPDMRNAEKALLTHFENATQIRFSVATPNTGAGPLEMNGSATECFCNTNPVPCGTVCPAGQELKHNVYQKIYHRAGNTMTSYTRAAGQMEYHPTHNHIHVDHWTNNTLRIRSSDPNPTHWPIIGTAYKVSFCLINLGSCDSYAGYCKDDQGNILMNSSFPNYNFGQVSGCGLGQGIYPGRVDEYSAGLDGQSIDLTNICNGTYYLVSITDPENAVKEFSENNNWAAIPLNLTLRPCNTCKTSFYADTLHGVDSLRVHFTDSTVAIPNQWLWNFGDGYTSTEQFPTHLYNLPGVYSVKLVTGSATGCKDSLTRNNFITVTRSPTPILPPATTNGTIITSITVGPNPFREQVMLSFRMPSERFVTAVLYDAIGRKLHSANIKVAAGSSSFRFSSTAFETAGATGVYFIKVDDGKGYSKVFRLIRE